MNQGIRPDEFSTAISPGEASARAGGAIEAASQLTDATEKNCGEAWVRNLPPEIKEAIGGVLLALGGLYCCPDTLI